MLALMGAATLAQSVALSPAPTPPPPVDSSACGGTGWYNYFVTPVPAGAEKTNGKCYKRGLNPDGYSSLTWHECKQSCDAMRLAEGDNTIQMPCIRTEVEAVHVHDVAGTNQNNCQYGDTTWGCAWVGLRQPDDFGATGGWYWDGGPGDPSGRTTFCDSTFYNWAPGQPNDWADFSTDCVLMGQSDGTTKWNDELCESYSTSRCYCEKTVGAFDAPPPPPPSPPPPPKPPPPPYNCPAGWNAIVDEWGTYTLPQGKGAGKCYKRAGGSAAVYDKKQCDVECASMNVGGTSAQPLCISTMEENLGIHNLFSKMADGRRKAECCGNGGVDGNSCCIWIGLEQKDDTHGTQFHWDYWPNGCASGFRNWRPGQPNDRLGWGTEQQDCTLMGFDGHSQWWDVNCTGYKSACICEIGGNYNYIIQTGTDGTGETGSLQAKIDELLAKLTTEGGGISGFGVFMLILVFGCLFMMCGFYCGRPEKLDAIKAKMGVAPRARTGVTRTNQVGIGAGLAANDSCASSYTAPLPALAITPGSSGM